MTCCFLSLSQWFTFFEKEGKKSFILFTFFLLFSRSYGQQPEQILNQWATQNPIEKIYFHFDRNDYIAGQTIWFKGYVYSDFLPAGSSSDLFIELMNASSLVIYREALPLFAGFAHGQIELPDTLPGGNYLLRAYTATMLNHDPGFLYTRNFFIIGKNKRTAPPGIEERQGIRMEFFPEGGNFITGLSNSVAYKATNENGFPVSVSGVIKKENGEQIAAFSSYHDGMGYFDITAEEKNSYYAVLNDDIAGKKYHLPSQTIKGVVFRVISNGKTKTFEILQRNDDALFKASYMIGQMQHHVVFKKVFKEDDNEKTGIIPTEKLSSGILHITVFNKDGLPLAERLTFIDNKEYILHGDVLPDTLDFSTRGKNHFTISLVDTVQGSFSMSVVDPAFDLLSLRQENIFSGLLLTSDLKGYIHNPAYYFSATNDSVQNALDLVMMTNGWRRFNWNAFLKDPLPSNKYKDPRYITLSGKINVEGTKKPFADKDLYLFVVSPRARNIQMIHTDGEGHFSLDSVLFFGNARILFTDIRGKKSKFIDVKLDGDSLHQDYRLPKTLPVDNSLTGISSADLEKRMLDEYNAVIKAEGLMLEGVTVKGRTKTDLEEVEEKYVSGLFSGFANSTLDLTKEDLIGYPDIFDYLKMRVPGLQVTKDPEGPGYAIEYRQQSAVSSRGTIPMTIFLNEIPTDADVVLTIPAYEIALVKVYSNFVGDTGNAPGGVLAIYTKKGSDRHSLPSPGAVSDYRGYSIVKEFYSPDYSMVKNNNKADYRMTLYWNPAIIVNGINPKLPVTFYNNDRTKQFKIVVEGINIDGKLLMIEKIIGAKKAF